MLDAETRACFTLIPQTSRMLGVDLPPEVAEALALTRTRPPELAAPPTTEALAAAIAEAVQADRDPATDKTVQTLLTRRQLAELNVGHQLAAHAEDRLGSAIKESAAAVVDSWRGALTAEAEALTAAKRTLGPVNVDDVFAWKNPTEAAAAAWAVSRTSGARFDAAARCWWTLGLAAHVPLNPHRRAAVYGSVTLDQWRALPAQPTAWEFVCCGVPSTSPRSTRGRSATPPSTTPSPASKPPSRSKDDGA